MTNGMYIAHLIIVLPIVKIKFISHILNEKMQLKEKLNARIMQTKE